MCSWENVLLLAPDLVSRKFTKVHQHSIKPNNLRSIKIALIVNRPFAQPIITDKIK